MTNDLKKKISKNILDINNHELFFNSCIKGFIMYMGNNVKVRGNDIPHLILSTGDDIMYRELMNYKFNQTGEITDEDFIYNQIPRCIVDLSGINIAMDKLTQPYTRALFEVEYEDNLREFSAEMSRIPITLSVTTKYYLDTFTDSLSVIQYLLSHAAFVKKYNINYLGQTIGCSIKLSDTFDVEKQIELDFSSDSKYRTINITYDIETNIPIYNELSIVETNEIIGDVEYNLIYR